MSLSVRSQTTKYKAAAPEGLRYRLEIRGGTSQLSASD